MAVRSCWKSRHKNSVGAAPCWTRPGLLLVLLLFVTQFRGIIGSVGVTSVVQKDAEFDVIYSDTVTSGNQTIYAFNHTILRNKVSLKSLEYTINPGEVKVCEAEVSSPVSYQTEGVRVSVDVLSQILESPILFVVRQKQAVLSFQIPLILRGL